MASGLDRGTIMALVAMAAGVFLIANDFTALGVAIPTIEQEFGVSLSTAQWVMNGYTVVFGVLIVTGGRIADQFGRRRVFLVGASIFAGFSLLGAVSPTVGLLIGSRVAMGVGGALAWPAVLGMTYAILPAEKAGLAGGLIIGVAGTGNAVGPLIGGVLTDTLGWRWLFVVNLPVTLAAVWITLRFVEENRDPDAVRTIDVPGVATLSIGVIAILVALDQGSTSGYGDPVIIALALVGIAALTGFAFVEPRQGAAALVPTTIVRNRQFIVSAFVTLLCSAVFFAAVIYLPQFMEKELGFSPMQSGAGLLPLMVVFAGSSFVSGPLFDRLGAKTLVTGGAAALALGMFLLSQLSAGSGWIDLVPGMVVLGFGVGIFYSSITTASVTALEESQASLAGGIIYMCQIAGGTVGLGANTAIVVAASSLPDGISTAFLVDAVLALVGSLIALALVGGPLVTARHRLRGHHRAHAP